MPGKRSEGQRLVAVPMDSELLSLMDQKRGSKNRSQFIRDAIAKMLGLSSDITRAPDRVKVRLNVTLNETADSPPVTETRKPVTYPKPKRGTKKKP